ncbi:hypothetical protein PROFUN_04010 [Planoprotostelium fungivorum]|uniref:Uncharacterized protein n=1 Tax=Planoprotostelium fungivorum TaxID=1890364 RepID=A0A2P6NW45_9EUKA|nr:hypothetical protein PROFUN_04010 [Planoprotostelium fungivorum]
MVVMRCTLPEAIINIETPEGYASYRPQYKIPEISFSDFASANRALQLIDLGHAQVDTLLSCCSLPHRRSIFNMSCFLSGFGRLIDFVLDERPQIAKENGSSINNTLPSFQECPHPANGQTLLRRFCHKSLNLLSILSDWESDMPLPTQTAQGATSSGPESREDG